MDSNIQALRVENLETRLDLTRFVRTTLELQFEFAQSVMARQILAHQWTQVVKECGALQFALELLKREEELGH